MSFGIILPTIAQKIPSYVPTNGLVGWWPFNGNANDESGNGNNGTVNGATLTADRNGKANSAYSFDGNSQNILLNKNLNSNISNSITIALWVKIPQNGGGMAIVQNYNKSPYNTLFAVSTSPNYHQYILYGDNCNDKAASNFYKNKNTSMINEWNLLVYTIDTKNSLKLYCNNQFMGEKNDGTVFSNNCNQNTSLRFGGDWVTNDPQWFKGIIDDIAIYNRALTQEEITNLYKGCAKETATLNPTNGVVLKNASPITLSASPVGGVFAGEAITNGQFAPAKANLGTNTVNYLFTNSTGCQDTTQFKVMVYDTLGNVCSSTDTLKIKVKLTTGIYSKQTTNLSVYPNPTSDVLIIDASDVKTLSGYSYRILDIQGKEVYKAVVSNAKTEISLKTIGAKGVYILHILDANNTSIENKKIVLE